jgi:hypothetical protein
MRRCRTTVFTIFNPIKILFGTSLHIYFLIRALLFPTSSFDICCLTREHTPCVLGRLLEQPPCLGRLARYRKTVMRCGFNRVQDMCPYESIAVYTDIFG